MNQHVVCHACRATEFASGLFRRHASFASAINRGIRKQANSSDRLGTSHGPRKTQGTELKSEAQYSVPRSRREIERLVQPSSKTPSRLRREKRVWTQHEAISSEAPLGKPYTTAGSEFIYGTFAVKAALKANRRKFYKVYIWKGDRSTDDEYDHTIYLLAKARNVQVELVAGSWDKMMMKMSDQRPHNGYVLEASAIPKLPATVLQRVEQTASHVGIVEGVQSLEDKAVNSVFRGSTDNAVIPRLGNKSRYPFMLWLDRVTDTGNLGAIMRTAWFMGVDAVIVPEHGTAPFSPVTIKASAGAAEHLPILVIKREIEFIRESQQNGWKFIAAVAPDSKSTKKDNVQGAVFHEHDALNTTPCVLMVGNEGEGLRPLVQKAADNFVSISGSRSDASGVDSLNVSVAAALLTARFMSTPSAGRPRTGGTRSTIQNTQPARQQHDNAMF